MDPGPANHRHQRLLPQHRVRGLDHRLPRAANVFIGTIVFPPSHGSLRPRSHVPP